MKPISKFDYYFGGYIWLIRYKIANFIVGYNIEEALEEHYDEGGLNERERITKVLNTAKGTDCGCDDCKGVHNYIDLLVDLIQGNNK